METIYDHNPTHEELKLLGDSSRSEQWYIKNMSQETVWVELALLFRHRGDTKNENRAWSYVPDRRDEFLRGFDVIDLD